MLRGRVRWSIVAFALKFRQVSRQNRRSMNNAQLKIASLIPPFYPEKRVAAREREREEVEFIVSGEELPEFA